MLKHAELNDIRMFQLDTQGMATAPHKLYCPHDSSELVR